MNMLCIHTCIKCIMFYYCIVNCVKSSWFLLVFKWLKNTWSHYWSKNEFCYEPFLTSHFVFSSHTVKNTKGWVKILKFYGGKGVTISKSCYVTRWTANKLKKPRIFKKEFFIRCQPKILWELHPLEGNVINDRKYNI